MRGYALNCKTRRQVRNQSKSRSGTSNQNITLCERLPVFPTSTYVTCGGLRPHHQLLRPTTGGVGSCTLDQHSPSVFGTVDRVCKRVSKNVCPGIASGQFTSRFDPKTRIAVRVYKQSDSHLFTTRRQFRRERKKWRFRSHGVFIDVS